MKKLIIIGASGHGKVAADIAKLNGYESIVFLDDDESIKTCGAWPVEGKSSDFASFEGDVCVAIGNPNTRQKIAEKVEAAGRNLPVLIHPSAVVAGSASLGAGTVVAANAVINPYASVGKGCIVNTASSVDHDCCIGSFVHIAVGAHVAGTVSVGDRTWIGAGAIVSNNIGICADCMVGAGSVVVKDITENGTYVGVPARKMR